MTTWQCRVCPARFTDIRDAEAHLRDAHRVMAFLLSRRLPGEPALRLGVRQRADRPGGHELAREIIAKHGVNRYPTADRSLLKLMEEVGELTQAYLRDGTADLTRVRKEYADAGLVLYAVGDALGLDLEAEMRAVVDGETRRFG